MFADQDFASIVIDQDSSKSTAIDWINTHSYNWTEWGYDPTSPAYHPILELYNDYNGGDTGIPQTFVIDADGNTRWAQLGMISNNATLVAVINQLI